MMKDLLNNYKHRDRLIDFRPGLTAGDMRGRILILSRDKYGDTPVGAYIGRLGRTMPILPHRVRLSFRDVAVPRSMCRTSMTHIMRLTRNSNQS